ncbi:MAG: succinate dehydrogenase/fumarate reductase iron-sulfur subunit [Halobacteriaceae archaeon]
MSTPSIDASEEEPDDSAERPEGEGTGATSGPQQARINMRAGGTRTQHEAGEATISDAATVHLKVFRYDPEVEAKQEPRFDDFHIPFEQGMSVLDALIYARDEYDQSLTFRHSCRQAVCGSDVMFINGQQKLCCKTQLTDLDEPVRIEPLPHQEVVKDLVVDMGHFYDQMETVDPYFKSNEDPPGDLEERRQSPANREQIKMASRCIWCGACMSSCNIAAGDNQYLGPAAINKAYRFYMDERESEDIKEERLHTFAEAHGVWRCQTQFSCTEVCPKDIPLTEHIQALKRESVKANLKFW